MPDETVIAQIGEEHVDIDTGTAQPALDGLAADLLLARRLREVDEGRVRRQNPPLRIGHHKGVGHFFDDAQQVAMFGGRGGSRPVQ